MKRIGQLFERVLSRENLLLAACNAGRGKRTRPYVKSFFTDLDDRLRGLQAELQSGRFRFEPYQAFEVRDTKTRTIHAPSFRDRVVHQAIISVTGPVFENGAIAQSYACRLGKGQHVALRQAATWTRRTLSYGKIDVRRFYDSVDHARLRQRLARRFREQRLLKLFDSLLASYESSPGKGLPIGALTSQYLGNFVLDEFDARMKASGWCGKFVRYMDDIVIWAGADDLPKIRALADVTLNAMGLRMKQGGEWNRCSRGIPFLGFVIYPDRVRLGRMGRQRLRRKWGHVQSEFRDGRIPEYELQQRCTSLFAHAAHGDDLAWRRVVVQLRLDQGSRVVL